MALPTQTEYLANLAALQGISGATSAAGLTTEDMVAIAATKVEVCIPIGTEATALTAATRLASLRLPFAFTLTGVRMSLGVTSSSGIPTVDINKNGSTVLSTKLTVDVGELTSTTAAAPAVLTTTTGVAFAADDEITLDGDVAGTSTAGVKVWLIGRRTS